MTLAFHTTAEVGKAHNKALVCHTTIDFEQRVHCTAVDLVDLAHHTVAVRALLAGTMMKQL